MFEMKALALAWHSWLRRKVNRRMTTTIPLLLFPTSLETVWLQVVHAHVVRLGSSVLLVLILISYCEDAETICLPYWLRCEEAIYNCQTSAEVAFVRYL